MRVYVDGVMGINFLVDLLLLLAANRLTGYPDRKIRLLAAAALGGVYSGVCLIPTFRFLGNLLWRTVCLVFMGGIAFGWDRSSLRRCGVFLLLSLALGGLAVCFDRVDAWMLLLACGVLWALCHCTWNNLSWLQEYVTLQIRNGDRQVRLLALRDTGNTLRDPVTGQQALVIALPAAVRLTGLTEEQIRDPMSSVASRCIPGLRLIPFRTVGQGNGMMLAMRFSDVTINGRKGSALVAFAPESFGREKPYQALTGGIAW